MERIERELHTPNVGRLERWASVIAGMGLLATGLRKRSLPGVALALAGSSLLERGASGHCAVYRALGVDRHRRRGHAADKPGASTSVPYGTGVRVERAITVRRPADVLYRFWRNFENLPLFMDHVETVRTLGPDRSHWVVRSPMGRTVEWEAVVHTERPNRWIAWRTLPGSDVDHAGSVHFEPLPGGQGTEVHVELEYRPPGGKVGAVLAKLLGEDPERQVADDLRRFQQRMEAGELAAPVGSPAGRNGGGRAT